MLHHRLAASLPLLVALLVALAGCKGDDPLYCDLTTECADPHRSFCDIDGRFPASNGTGNTCIEPPADDACTRAELCEREVAPHCNAVGACVECLVSGHCPAELPYCEPESESCESCTSAEDGDAVCAGVDETRPLCADDGACVQCIDGSDCPSARPICQLENRSCRGCVASSECESLVCTISSGACVAPEAIVYVDLTGADDPECGTLDEPCATLAAGLARVTEQRKTVRLAPGTYAESIAVSEVVARILGAEDGEVVLRPTLIGGADAVTVTGTAALTLSNVVVDGANAGAGSDGLRCTGEAASLTVEDGEVRGFRGLGVVATDCQLSVRRSVVARNAGGGIEIDGGDYALVNDVIVDNGAAGVQGSQRGGVYIADTNDASQTFAFNTVVGNLAATGAVVASGVTCSVTNVTVDGSIVRLRGGGGGLDLVIGDCAFAYSNIEGGAEGTGNFDAEPRFVDPAAGDFHLQPSSPCRDAADPAATEKLDLDREPRPQGEAHDCGADEIADS